MEEAAAIADAVAPEHLQIATADPLQTLSLVHNAGEILLGQHTPFSLANYAIGANAVLPDRRQGADVLRALRPGLHEVLVGRLPDGGGVSTRCGMRQSPSPTTKGFPRTQRR